MSIETLEQAIEETQAQLDGRESRRLIAWAVVTIVLFFIPIVLFFKLAEGTPYETSYAPIVLVWLMVSMGVGNLIATALIAPRTVELKLAVATASSVLSLVKDREQATPQPHSD
ncbi:hypothetical protein Ga0123461_1055 [Mariprofundus aestuarium]|uniref:Uncharacterized protein n=1 Tax=Mariprofundus aestuarium TaxID=1921086 RepID=A0A2K8L3E2_MARES|nr:hypothetical protein [Mariprofundus aestuarium]ATX79474.1 hypothetical protein Ga0123461_1055 [Mariprofundus aestuarium]